MDTNLVHVQLRKDLRDRINDYAKKESRTQIWVLEKAIVDYLDGVKEKYLVIKNERIKIKNFTRIEDLICIEFLDIADASQAMINYKGVIYPFKDYLEVLIKDLNSFELIFGENPVKVNVKNTRISSKPYTGQAHINYTLIANLISY